MLRHRLHFGPYRTPRFRIGQRVEDERRGTVRIVGLSDGPIAWPIGQTVAGALSRSSSIRAIASAPEKRAALTLGRKYHPRKAKQAAAISW